GGTRGLADAVQAAGHDLDDVLFALDAAMDVGAANWATMSATELVDHLEATHHRYLHQELPHLSSLMAKVLEVHGERHPELLAISTKYAQIRADLEPHLMKEERVLFPMIRALDAVSDGAELPEFHCGTVRNPISCMLRDHDAVGDLLRELSDLTNSYSAPPEGCVSYKTLFGAMRALETDTHSHIHKENNVLFPMVLAIEAGLTHQV
ncbi:MAG: hemerythrin domain-containing protein, partial [Acidimicrobiales bacterium]